MKILLMRPSDESQTLSRYNPELMEVDTLKRTVGVIKPIAVDELLNTKLFSNHGTVNISYEKFIGRKIKSNHFPVCK